MIFWHIYQICAYVCQYESEFTKIKKVESIQREKSPNFIFPTTKYYANCTFKDSKNKKKLEMCLNCYNRAEFDNNFFNLLKKCNKINIDRIHQIFSAKDNETNHILVIRCKYKLFLPIYSLGNLFVIDLQKFDRTGSKVNLALGPKTVLLPYVKLKDIDNHQYLKAENCIISMSLDEYIDREYSKNIISQYTEAFNNLYLGDISIFGSDGDSEHSGESDTDENTISNIFQDFLEKKNQTVHYIPH